MYLERFYNFDCVLSSPTLLLHRLPQACTDFLLVLPRVSKEQKQSQPNDANNSTCGFESKNSVGYKWLQVARLQL